MFVHSVFCAFLVAAYHLYMDGTMSVMWDSVKTRNISSVWIWFECCFVCQWPKCDFIFHIHYNLICIFIWMATITTTVRAGWLASWLTDWLVATVLTHTFHFFYCGRKCKIKRNTKSPTKHSKSEWVEVDLLFISSVSFFSLCSVNFCRLLHT